ncbi:MAG TPA: protein translocase subunit SecD [Phycisphaerae bacterium]|nr:protein translocase subunit SecD [Phycisphaerae bacterium]
MEAKNLPLKFAFVGVLVLLCAYGLVFQKLRLGIDLRGGHSLIFEIKTSEAEIRALEQAKKDLEAQHEAAADPKSKEQLKQQLDRIKASLADLRWQASARGDLAERMIAILKERIDPQGFSNLEMRPLGRNRIEIRMPAGSKESRQAKRVYDQALKTLEAGNIHRSQIDDVENTSGTQRQERIRAIAGSDQALADRLTRYGQAVDALRKAKTEKDRLQRQYDQLAATSQPEDEQKQLAAALAKAEQDLVDVQQLVEELRGEILAGNISRAQLDSILRNYVAPEETAGGKEQSELKRRMELFGIGLDKLRAEHKDNPGRLKEADEVVEAYKAWTRVRGHLDDPSDLIRLVRKAGVLEFRIAPAVSGEGSALSEEEVKRYKGILHDPSEGPESLLRRNDEFLWFPIRRGEEKFAGLITADMGGRTYLLLYNKPGFTMLQRRGVRTWSLDGAYASYDDRMQPAVRFEFDERGARIFYELTGRHLKRPMAILLDDEVISAPTIQAKISDKGIITGHFDLDEVKELAHTLEAGSLPARLNPEPVAMNTFGPSFGEENLRSALKAGYASACVIVAFMLAYYLLSGAIASAALALNLLLVMGSMSLLSAVFTLPGIAGVILIIGMAVDANVLIYERLREEQAKGQSIRMALKNAYDRAFSAIFDSNVTTLITCSILGWVGSEEVRGFAVTLGLGVVFNIFTAVYVTRWVFQLLLEFGLLKRPLKMMKLIGVPKIDWMSKRYYFWTFSVAMAVIGIASLVWQGRNLLGIEFSSGTQAILTFKDDALIGGRLPDDELVRREFAASAAGHEKLYASARVEMVETERVSSFLKDHDTDGDGKITLAEWRAQGLNEDFFKLVDGLGDSDGALSAAELERNLPARSYQISTTESSVPLIQQVAAKAFGDALVQRQRIDFELVKGLTHPGLRIELAEDGRTFIKKGIAETADPRYRRQLLDAEGGVLFVVKPQAPASRVEVAQRIRDMRLQPDFAQVTLNSTEVVGLTLASAEKYSELAIFVTPADPAVADNPRAWGDLAQKEQELMEASLHRQEAMVATNFDPAVAGQARQRAIVAMILAWVAIIAYLWLRFGSARWGLAAVVCLIHDITLVLGMVAASGWLHTTVFGRAIGIDSFKIDLAMVAAMLTIIGYSVNDTIVVFDRIRENRGKLLAVSPQVVNLSINQTLSRTLLAGGTTFVVVMVMFVAGGQGIHAFTFALLMGILFGTYSSIAVASPILLGFRQMLSARPAASVLE